MALSGNPNTRRHDSSCDLFGKWIIQHIGARAWWPRAPPNVNSQDSVVSQIRHHNAAPVLVTGEPRQYVGPEIETIHHHVPAAG